VILSAMEKIIKRTIDSIDQQLAADIIKQSSAELTQSKVRSNLLLQTDANYWRRTCVFVGLTSSVHLYLIHCRSLLYLVSSVEGVFYISCCHDLMSFFSLLVFRGARYSC